MKNSTILHIPHASTDIPAEYLPAFAEEKLPREFAVMTDWFCDELFECEREKIVFPVSRLLCDVERFRKDEDEIMAEIGMSTVYESCSDLTPLRHVDASEKERILCRYYDTHHRNLTNAVEAKLSEFGRCFIVDCHSFYPTALPYELDQSADRPDFCIGTSDFHTPEKCVDTAVRFLTGKGFSVRINSPFSGAIVPLQYYQTEPKVFSVMIEVNRKLYMREPGIKNERFSFINSVLKECIEAMEDCISGENGI